MALDDMKPRSGRSQNGNRYTEQPHQVHMRFITGHLRPHNISWSHFSHFMKSDDYPIAGTRKQRIEGTAKAIDSDPGFVETVVNQMKNRRK